MKLVNYKLQSQIEYLSRDKPTQFFADYLRSVIEDTSKPYYKRADYIGLSLYELKQKIDLLSTDIKELEALKKKLSEALDIAKEITASIFVKNGIDRIDGTVISSLTLTKPSVKTKTTISILNPSEVIKLGYVKLEPDIDAIAKAIELKQDSKLAKFITIESTTTKTPAKVKVNTKHLSINAKSDALDEFAKNQESEENYV